MIDLPESSVSALLNQIWHGDDKAATRLYRHYHGFIYAFLRHRVHNDAAADDITHEVFFAVFHKPLSFHGNSKFSTWLCQIARHKAADWWRKQASAEFVSEDGVLEAEIDPNWDFVIQLEAAQDAQVLRHCIDKLPSEQREAIFWTFYQDASEAEVARHQGCPTGTVKSRLFNARKRLRDCVSNWMEGSRHD
jgi:RNA polymerase sigma-70 factor (ECF subfamily)